MSLFFSLIIPTCNRFIELNRCLELLTKDVHGLDKSEYEIIVTDDSVGRDIQLFLSKSYPFVRYVQGPQKGPAANRNNGVKYATGNWIIFIDDDCLPSSKILLSYKRAILSSDGIQVFEGSIHSQRARLSPLEFAPINTTGGCLWSCNFCISRILFKQLNGFDENFYHPHLEDVDLRERILLNDFKIKFVPDAKVVHPWREITSGKRIALFQESSVYYSYKWGVKPSLFKLLIVIIKTHISMMRGFLFNKLTPLAVIVCVQHVFYVVKNFSKWQKKYANQSKTYVLQKKII